MPTLNEPEQTSVLVIGEALMDIIKSANETEVHPGGSPYNIATGLAGLGMDVSFHSQIGSDFNGKKLKSLLSKAGVSVTPESFIAGATSTATANLNESGVADYDFEINWDIPSPVYSGEAVIHIGSIGAFLQPGAGKIVEWLGSINPEVIVTFDPNIRPSLIGPLEENFAQFEKIATRADILKMSDEDSDYLFPGKTPQEVTQLLVEKYRVKLAVITRGALGAVAATKSGVYEHPARKVTVKDTIGAGDSFMAGLINALTIWPHSFGKLTFGSFEDLDFFAVINFASECAAFTVGQVGAVMPSKFDMSSGIID